MSVVRCAVKSSGWLCGATCALLLLAYGVTVPGVRAAANARPQGPGDRGGGQPGMQSQGGPRDGHGAWGMGGRSGGRSGGHSTSFGARGFGGGSFDPVRGYLGSPLIGSFGSSPRFGGFAGTVRPGSWGVATGTWNGRFGSAGRFGRVRDFSRFGHDRHFGLIVGDFDGFFGSCWDQGLNTYNCADFAPFAGCGFFQLDGPTVMVIATGGPPDTFVLGPTWPATDFCWWRDHEDLDEGVTIILQF